FVTSVRAYIDWNQDGDFADPDEYYFIGIIENSTGTDGIQAIADIDVPAGALEGNTRMRVTKKFLAGDPSPNDGCTGGSSFGQAEDYTINVTAGGPPPPAGTTVYALNLRASCGTDFGTFDIDGPYNIDPISSITSSIFAGDFDDNDVLYALDNDAQTLLTIDTATGVETTVGDRKSTRLNSSHVKISYAVFCLKKKK